MRLLLCFIAAITLSACQHTAEPSTQLLPEHFLGIWHYTPPYDITINIHKNGTITETTPTYSDYKVAYIENPNSVYLIVKDNMHGTENFGYVHLTTKYAFDLNVPNRFEWWFGCDPKSKKEWNWSLEQYKRRILSPKPDECDIQGMYSAVYYYRNR